MSKLYYTPPTDKQFNELKEKAIELWRTYNNCEYVDSKVNKIKDAENVEDNFMFIVAMFDAVNQKLLASVLSSKTRKAIRDRMIDGGSLEYFIPF